MNRDEAIAQIQKVFDGYRMATASDGPELHSRSSGKLYELFVLSHLIDDLARRGFRLNFVGNSLQFKAAPGQIRLTDPHFEVRSPYAASVDWRIFVDIEFMTIGQQQVGATDGSSLHELDIMVTSATAGYPTFQQIALAVECKAVARFEKYIVKEVLGLRRELSFFVDQPQSSMLTFAGASQAISVRADPPSEFWLAFSDPHGTNYRQSPAAFGVEFRLLEP